MVVKHRYYFVETHKLGLKFGVFSLPPNILLQNQVT